MKPSILERIGLTSDQATTYSLLLKRGALTPRELCQITGEKRTNAYMALAKLQSLGLAERHDDDKRLTYHAVHPSRLEKLIESKETELQQAKAKLNQELPELLTAFYTNATEPGIRFYEGEEGLHKVYQDHLDTQAPVYFVRTPADEKFFGDKLYDYMQKRADQNIPAYGIAPYSPQRLKYSQQNDQKLKRQMTWCSPKQYFAPVEISIYGPKVAFISFGKEIVASIIASPQIADAMRQLFTMAQAGADK